MLGLGKARGGKTIAVADIDGDSAGVAIVKVPPEGPVRVFVAERSTLSMEDRSTDASASGILAELGKTAEKALAAYAGKLGEKKEAPHVEGAYAIIRAPWARSKTIRAESKFPEETGVEKGMIATLAEEALRADTEFDHGKTLDASIMRVELNGYPTAKPEGKRAKRVSVSALLSECDPSIRSGAAEALQRTFACPPPTLRSGTRALLAVLRESGALLKDCFIVNMASRATNLIAVRKGVVSDVAVVPEGSSSILKRVAEGKMPEETLTMIRLLAQDRCEGEACEAIKAAIGRAEPELVKVFGATLEKMAATRRLPNTLILFAPEDLKEWLAHFFSRIDFAPFTLTSQPFSLKKSDHAALEGLLAFESGVTPDHALAIACALVNTEEGPAT